jgi:hypothetical protein
MKSGKDYFIKCPYCRNIQFELLPDLQQEIYPKVYGINTDDRSYIRVADESTRGYTHKGVFYNMMASSNKCIHHGCSSTFCGFNDQFKMFCCSAHMAFEINKKNQEIKLERIKQNQEKKMKIKEEKEKIKQEKAKIKEEKANMKKNEAGKVKQTTSKKTVNTVIGTSPEINEYLPPNENETETETQPNEVIYCCAILKTGIKKGQPCGSNIFAEKLCKRHYKLNQSIQPTQHVGSDLEVVDLDKLIEKITIQ